MKKRAQNKDKKFEIIALLSLLLSLLVLLLILNWLRPLLLWDENVYLGNARSHIAKSNFTEDFRFPLLEWLIALVWLFGESLLAAKFLIILLSVAAVFFTYLVLREYFTVRKAFLGAVCFAFSPLIIFWGFRVYADIPAMCFTMVSFYCLLKKEKAGQKERKKVLFIAVAGIMAALAFLSRFPLILFPLSAAVYYLYKKEYRAVLIFAAFFILTLIPWFVYNQIHYQNPIWDLKEQYAAVQKWTSREPVMKQIKNLFTSIGILAFLIPVGFYSLLKKHKKNQNLIWLVLGYVVLSFTYYFAFVKLKDMRYYLAFLPLLYIIAFDGAFWLSRKKKAKTIIYAIIAINAAALLGWALFVQAKAIDYERDSALAQSIAYLKEKNASDLSIVSNVWPWYGYYLNAKVACLWSENITELIALYEPHYIIFDNHLGTPFNRTILDFHPNLKLEKEIRDKHGHEVTIYSIKATCFACAVSYSNNFSNSSLP